MLIKSRIKNTALDPASLVTSDSNKFLESGDAPNTGGGGVAVNKIFSVTSGTGFHYERLEHSLDTQFILVQVFEYDSANQIRGELVQADVLASNDTRIPTGIAKSADTLNNVTVRIAKEAVSGTQTYVIICR